MYFILMVTSMLRLPLRDVDPNFQIKYQMCKYDKNKNQAEWHVVTTSLLFLNFKSRLSQNGLHHATQTTLLYLTLTFLPIRQTFLTLLLAVPLRTEVLSRHLSPVSHRLKRLFCHR